MNKDVESLVQKDLKHIWHPCTQMKDYEELPLIPIKKGKGVYLEDFEGNSFIDCISSWWVNLFGHSNDFINDAIKNQIESLEHVILTCFTHEPIINLSKRLVDITPKGLNKVFYADNGSSGVEVALKMSFQYFANKGVKKTKFISLENGYHGETFGALSVSDVGLYKECFEPILLQNEYVSVPKDQSKEEAIRAANELELVLQKDAKIISALILEPLIQCAGYMNMYNPMYLKLAKDLCKKYGVHFIADEVAVGFGRTGKMFACEHANISPDFMVLSKGLTGGYLPLSVVLTHDEIYDAFYAEYNTYKAFLHSHSYTGNPITCSIANAVLDIFENENVLEVNSKKIDYLSKGLEKFKSLNNVSKVRQTGFVAAFDIDGYEAKDRIGVKVFQEALEKGVFIRPLGNVVYFMTPYVITYEEIDKMLDTVFDIVKKL